MNLILLRGLSRQSAHWGDFPRNIADDLGYTKVVTLDLPGFGSQSDKTFPSTIEEVIENLNLQLAEHRLESPCILIGLSLGGMIALHWASRHPNKFLFVAVINSSLSSLSPFHRRLRPAGLLALLGAIVAPTSKLREIIILSLTSNNRWKEPSPATLWVEIGKKKPVRLYQVYRQIKFSAKIKAPARLPIPLLVMGSTGDKLVNFKCSQDIASYYKARFLLHPNAGHDLTLDDPKWVITQIDHFTKNR